MSQTNEPERPVMYDDSPPPMAEQLKELVLLLRAVADSDAAPVGGHASHLVVIDNDTWKKVRAYRSPST